MSNDFFDKFKKIIRECNYDNTYKMAMAKSLVEISFLYDTNDTVSIGMDIIAKYYLKYYWNQTIFFDLVQGSNLKKTPVILQYTKTLISQYYDYISVHKPIRYERVESELQSYLKNELDECLNKIAKGLCKDVAWRFTFIDGVYNDDIYRFDKEKKIIIIEGENLKTLRYNYEDLFDLIDYRWGLILETFNNSPRINKKIKIIDGQDIKRTNLNRFRKYLDLQNPNHVCFICGQEIDDSEISIDHVIPWSYLYSDDIWNLVYVHKSCNSSKSNVVSTENEIRRLNIRNKMLQTVMHESDAKGKIVDELDIAIEKDYVEKFWIGCK
ncbi:MAG: HNH endonuclease [Erysipelotrichaceae bacterium]|nr:HNH endonuclease [Erysipelotrichaceae bacterium]